MIYSGVGRLGSFGGIKRKTSGREWFVSNERTCGGMRGGRTLAGMRCGTLGGQLVMTVRVHGSKLGTPCSSMMAAVLTVAEKTATMRR